MNTKQLEYFIAVAESLSFTKTAKKFFISQTAITQQIKSLENQLGVKLFNRTNRHVELTPSGEVFVHEAKAIISRTKLAFKKAQLASIGISGTLNIGFVPNLEKTNFPEIIRGFHEKYPNIFLSFIRDNPGKLFESILNGNIDVAFIANFGLEKYKDIEYKKFCKYPLVAVLSPSHPLASKLNIDESDLKDESFIFTSSYTDEYVEAEAILKDFLDCGFMPKILYHPDNMETALLMASVNMGVTILPSYAANGLRNSGQYAIIPLKNRKHFDEIVIAWKKGNANPTLTQFLNIV